MSCFRSNLIGEVCVLEDMTSHLPVIEVRIEECRGKPMSRPPPYSTSQIIPEPAVNVILMDEHPDEGIDVRIRGLKIKSSCERDLGLNADVFQSSNLVRYPRLEGTPPEILYRRALVIQRSAGGGGGGGGGKRGF